MSKKGWYELRVREMVSPERWVKKSKFYEVRRPGDAVKIYTKRAKKNGTRFTIMWCEKDRRHDPERLAVQAARVQRDIRAEQRGRRTGLLRDVKEFLSLGSELLQELRQNEKEKVLKRRYNDQREKETPH